ncbi:P-type conjugative transfer ATPase TrbB [Burkholderia cenocepacia]|uniref:P-type conjugative transfer ATPase TrbB n=1 Tax=Burkholderia cenocepacia TaxID=95486 RepID=UPI0013DF8082|nr:P-type conjugative transfer ATPase TrbB [Burkholderia cenocepacia]MCW3587396.1 P-type conjugative transfer ATPase TrbB [Burkholderia cenocepacia]MCW3632600.1 P-type conjugative transfer ATPase TrbB [Burkholderia cenocepacia]MCW5181831.1 P-type conjugative transfer ATPase TrbB [Burkholderia cenocepacia]
MSDVVNLEDIDLSGMSEAEKVRDRRLKESISHALGPRLMELISDPRTQELNINPDSSVWWRRAGEPKARLDFVVKPSAVASAIRVVASYKDTTVDAQNPILECEFPIDGSRFSGLLPPVVKRPMISIRKKAPKVISANEYVKSGTMTFQQAEAIRKAVRSHLNILVAGGTASGKTTLLNMIMQMISEETPDDRIVIIEDTEELQCDAEEVAFMRSSDDTSMLDLLKATLRHSPDRICVGEVRDGTAFTLLKAWNTGHSGGLGTLHSDGRPQDALNRLDVLVQEASPIPQRALIGAAVHVVVNIEKFGFGRRVTGVSAVKGYDPMREEYLIEKLC